MSDSVSVRSPNSLDRIYDSQELFYNTGSWRTVWDRWCSNIRQEPVTLARVRSLAPDIMRLISDERILYLPARMIHLKGRRAPGPDGIRIEQLDSNAVWSLCRYLRDQLRDDVYQPGPVRHKKILKTSGNGYRWIAISNLKDRIVTKAITIVLQTLLDPLQDAHSFGYRPKRDRRHAMAVALRMVESGRHVWLVQDIRNAFDRVPRSRLLNILNRLLPDPALQSLLQRILAPLDCRHTCGIKQGSSLSPLMLNIYLNDVLDRKWRVSMPNTPLIRYADDLLILCRSVEEAHAADEALRNQIRPHGFELKHETDAAVVDIHSQSANWLGYTFDGRSGSMSIQPAFDRYLRLAAQLLLSHEHTEPAERASHRIDQWIRDLGPCQRDVDRDAIRSYAVGIIGNSYSGRSKYCFTASRMIDHFDANQLTPVLYR